MLVLSRKLGEEIRIGDEITVKVLSIRGKRVKLGFHCPAEVSIQRREVFVALGGADAQSDRELIYTESR